MRSLRSQDLFNQVCFITIAQKKCMQLLLHNKRVVYRILEQEAPRPKGAQWQRISSAETVPVLSEFKTQRYAFAGRRRVYGIKVPLPRCECDRGPHLQGRTLSVQGQVAAARANLGRRRDCHADRRVALLDAELQRAALRALPEARHQVLPLRTPARHGSDTKVEDKTSAGNVGNDN